MHHLPDPKFSKRNGALGGDIGLFLALLLDQATEPDIEGDQRHAGEQRASGDCQ